MRWPSVRTQGIISLLLLVGLVGLYVREEYRSFQLCPNWPEQHQPAKGTQQNTDQHGYLADFWDWLTHDAVSFFTFVLAVFTGLLLLVAYFQFRVLIRSDETARISANAARDSAVIARNTLIASHRAWLKVDVVPGDLIFYKTQGMHTPVQIKIENIGNAPAIHIETHAWLYAGTQPLAPLRARSAEVAKSALIGGFSLLPGERFPEFTGYGSVGNDAFLPTDQVTDSTDGYGRIGLYVLICVDYSFPSDSTNHHQFQVAYELKHADEMPISVTEGVIAANKLKFSDVGLGLTRLVT